ncbi:hypothetical protein C1645_769375 [Glomus cerebriforme]|uniref:F-box domain-containing protein n=1 Tax=Glomus cerebriforme TaxID=658196 RepID=A0A397T047_9GLOM|nr:hypothetical protein C1645_769375 [Glomus cerebriforme]
MIIKIIWDFFAMTREKLELIDQVRTPKLKFNDNISTFERLITIVMIIFNIISNSGARIEKLELVLDDDDVTLFLDLEEYMEEQDNDSINMLYLYQRRIYPFMNIKFQNSLSRFFKKQFSKKCFGNLKYLYCGKGIIKENILTSLSNICHNLSILKINEENFMDIKIPLISIIKRQKNLEYLQIIGNNNLNYLKDENANITEIISALESDSILLKKIELIDLYISSDKALKPFVKFKNLECLHLKGLNLPYKNFDYISTTDFPKLTSLILVKNYDGSSNFDQEPYTAIIQNQKISSNLKELQLTNYNITNNLELLKSINSNCKNLLDFAIQLTSQEDKIYLFSILNNCPMINKFHLEVFEEENSINNSDFIDELLKHLPKNLVELKLKGVIDTFNNLMKFFKNCDMVDLKIFSFNLCVEEFIEIEKCQEFIEGWSEKKGKKVESCQLIFTSNIEIRWK